MARAKVMGRSKVPNQRVNKSNSSSNPDRVNQPGKTMGGHNARTQATIKRLNMYRRGKPKRNTKGQIIQAAEYQSELAPGTQARVEPNRRWFGNTRVISQSSLQKFQTEIGNVINDPYQMVLKASKLPLSLLHERRKQARVHILYTESFEYTFGKKSTRKRPNISITDMEELSAKTMKSQDDYDADKDTDLVKEWDGTCNKMSDVVFNAGQSKRIWNELYKVLDCSDVVIQVLDARDPMGTRCTRVEKYLKKEKPHKHLIFVLNKVDLVPTWITKAWVAILSKERPTLAFHASITNPFGKGALINLLRQFCKLHSEKKNISCGFIGYPNVGKSSIINTLRKKKVCNVAPLAGETKVWQYITLMKKIFLVDCPGIVQPSGETETEIILKGVVRVEYVSDPDEHIDEILRRVKKEYIIRQYLITEWENAEDFLKQMARRTGKLLKGGIPDTKAVAKMVLNDWQRGKIPYFVRPEGMEDRIKAPDQSTTENTEQTATEATDADKKETDTVESAVTSEEVAEKPEDPNKIPTAVELEKNLQPIQQNFGEVKIGFDFDEDLSQLEKSTNNDEQSEAQDTTLDETIEESDDEDEEEDDGNDETIEEEETEMQEVTEVKPLSNRSIIRTIAEDPDHRSIDSHSKKIKKMRRFLSQNMKKRLADVAGISTRNENRVNIVDLQKQAKMIQKQDEKEEKKRDLEMNSKQKRKLARDQKSKKVGNHYYKTANVKNRNRDKKVGDKKVENKDKKKRKKHQ